MSANLTLPASFDSSHESNYMALVQEVARTGNLALLTVGNVDITYQLSAPIWSAGISEAIRHQQAHVVAHLAKNTCGGVFREGLRQAAAEGHLEVVEHLLGQRIERSSSSIHPIAQPACQRPASRSSHSHSVATTNDWKVAFTAACAQHREHVIDRMLLLAPTISLRASNMALTWVMQTTRTAILPALLNAIQEAIVHQRQHGIREGICYYSPLAWPWELMERLISDAIDRGHDEIAVALTSSLQETFGSSDGSEEDFIEFTTFRRCAMHCAVLAHRPTLVARLHSSPLESHFASAFELSLHLNYVDVANILFHREYMSYDLLSDIAISAVSSRESLALLRRALAEEGAIAVSDQDLSLIFQKVLKSKGERWREVVKLFVPYIESGRILYRHSVEWTNICRAIVETLRRQRHGDAV